MSSPPLAIRTCTAGLTWKWCTNRGLPSQASIPHSWQVNTKSCCPVTNTVKFADIFHNHKLQLKTKQSSILETERHQQIYWETALKFPVEISLKESCWVSMHNNKSIPQRISIAVISVQSYF